MIHLVLMGGSCLVWVLPGCWNYYLKGQILSQVWCYIPVILVLGRRTQECQKLAVIIGCILCS